MDVSQVNVYARTMLLKATDEKQGNKEEARSKQRIRLNNTEGAKPLTGEVNALGRHKRDSKAFGRGAPLVPPWEKVEQHGRALGRDSVHQFVSQRT